MLPRVIFFVFAFSVLALVVGQSGPSDGIVHHRAVGGNDMHKRASKPKGRGGRATWFNPGLGHCGGYNGDNDMIVALPTKIYGKGQYCGKRVKITNTKNGKSCYAKVVDSCPGCGSGDLDVSPKVFKAIAKNLDQGVATINWDLA